MAKLRLMLLLFNLIVLSNLLARTASASSTTASDAAASRISPSADIDLICHTDNPDECYPKVFQPTDEFQVVHDDQELPAGLHVRLNISTGKKEAKLYNPNDTHPEMEGLPVDSAVVVVEPSQAQELGQTKSLKIPANAPAYDPAGKIKIPPSANGEEGSAFYRSLTILKKGLDVDEALEMLEDISHDIYYGLKIAEDYDTVHELFCLATAPSPSIPANRARLAALTLASTLQNNPKALASLEEHWPRVISSSDCRFLDGSRTLGDVIFDFSPSPGSSGAIASNSPAVLRARLSLLSGLLRSSVLRNHFLHHLGEDSGPSRVLRLLTADIDETDEADWAPVRRTAAYLLLDNFLDAEMGAAVGEWPTRVQATDTECAEREKKKTTSRDQNNNEDDEACWDWRIGKFAERYKRDKGHWSHELKKKMVAQRRENLAKDRPDVKGNDGEKEYL